MRKSAEIKLRHLKTALTALTQQLNKGVDHLDTLTGRTIARTLEELVQEVNTLPKTTSSAEIAKLVQETLVGTAELQQQLEMKWRQELESLMARARERARLMDHELAEFTCLSVNGQEWGALCIRCRQWVFVKPHRSSGRPLTQACKGWST